MVEEDHQEGQEAEDSVNVVVIDLVVHPEMTLAIIVVNLVIMLEIVENHLEVTPGMDHHRGEAVEDHVNQLMTEGVLYVMRKAIRKLIAHKGEVVGVHIEAVGDHVHQDQGVHQ